MIAREFTLGLLVLYWSGTSFSQNSSEPVTEQDSVTTSSLQLAGSGSGAYYTFPPEVTKYANSPTPWSGPALGSFIWRQYVSLLKQGIVNGFLCMEKDLSSCKRRCGRSRKYNPHQVGFYGIARCHCDSMCTTYNDCCPDYLASCTSNDTEDEESSRSNQIAHASTDKERAVQKTCIKPGEKYGYVAVNICPSDWTDDEISIKCSCVDCTDVMSLIPVYDTATQLTYKNTFCARCHGATNASYFLMEGDCHPEFPGREANSSKKITAEDVLKTIPNETTELFKYFDSYCKWEFTPFYDMQPETCVPYYSKCEGNDTLWRNISFLCDKYSMAVCYKDSNRKLKWYRNPHCALCTNRSLEEILCFCADTGIPSPQKLTVDLRSPHFIRVTLDKGNIEKNVFYREKCKPGETYDVVLEKCVNLNPPKEILRVICNGNFTCVEVRDKSINKVDAKGTKTPLAKPTPTRITRVIQTSGDFPDPNRTGKEGSFYCKGNFSCAGFDNESKPTTMKPTEEYEPSSEGPSTTPRQNYTCYKLNYPVRDDDVITLPDNSVVIISQGKLYSDAIYLREGYICPKSRLEAVPVAQQGNPFNPPAVLIFGIRQRVFSCVFLFLSALALGNVLGVFLTVSKQRTIPGKIAMNTTAALFLSHTMLFVGAQSEHEQACRIIACFQHYFLLCSYFWISVMALDSSKVLAAHALTCKASTELMELATDNNRTPQKRRYTSSSSNEHAMVESVESIRKSSSRVTIKQSSASALLYGYAAFAWGTPLFIVATAMALDFSEIAEILYGKIYFCWIKNGRSSLLIFDAPVSIILIYNLETLVRTIMTLRRLDEESCVRSPRILRSEVWFYLKLTGIMAAIWICGLLFWVTKLPEIGYPYVIINTFLGFYVFHVIVIKKYIRSMCRDNVLESLQKRDPPTARRLHLSRSEIQTTSV